MSFQAQLVMLAWLPIVLYLFNSFPPRKAVIVSFIGGLLFLPQGAGFLLPLIPDYMGMMATCYGIALGIILFDLERLTAFRPSWIDLPMLIWCICPFFSSMSNGLGIYDGVNQTIAQTTTWGVPYGLGRLYLGSFSGLRELALNLVKGGIIYMPLCLFESRMSPQLHLLIYGYYSHSSGILQTYRLGGWRPVVFMQHGLMVGMWMMIVALVALWLWKADGIQKIWGMPIPWLVAALIVTFIFCRSTGTYAYFAFGVMVLFVAKWRRSSLPLLLLILGIFVYLYLGVTGNFDGDAIVSFLTDLLNPERAGSIAFRFENEELLRAKAQERLLFGWGGWGRNLVYAENWQGEIENITVTDSLWILAFGINGIVGLSCWSTSLLLPVVCFCVQHCPARTWFNPKVAPAAVLAVCLTLFVLDCLLNAMLNPIFPLISGGLAGLVTEPNNEHLTQLYRLKKGNKVLSVLRL